jgi:superfamily II DNA or RNA helicase
VRVDTSKPFKVIFSLNPDSELGAIIEPFAVQCNEKGGLTLTYQKLYAQTYQPFQHKMSAEEREAVKLTSEYSAENIAKLFNKKKDLRPQEFITKGLNEKLKEAIRPFVEEKVAKTLGLLTKTALYARGKTGNPAYTPLENVKDQVSVHFHFSKEDDGTRYYPTFRCGEEKITFVNKPVLMLTNKPCVLMSEDKLYRFDETMDGKKLTPFFSKWNIHIPKEAEPAYYQKFVSQQIENYTVIAKGFDIRTIDKKPVPILKLQAGINGKLQLQLLFDYEKENISAGESKKVFVRMEHHSGKYTYYKITRKLSEEAHYKNLVGKTGLVLASDCLFELPVEDGKEAGALDLIEWLNEHRTDLENAGIQFVQDESVNDYHIGKIQLRFRVEEKNDWFDVYAIVTFGDYQIPFVKLKKYILNDIQSFPLPDGKVAVIPKEWFTLYKDMLSLSADGMENQLVVRKHHLPLLEDIFPSGGNQVEGWKDALSKYRTTAEEKPLPLPEAFKTIMRPYQQEGFLWLQRLAGYRFGGVLADDMGLGKTIQTLSLLLSIRENASEEPEYPAHEEQLSLFGQTQGNGKNKRVPSLIVMPTSLIHNWLFEIKKWAPALKAVNYTGLDREDRVREFAKSDVILTTYGTARNDIELLKGYEFNYVILDESQVIKNPLAKISKAIRMLRSRHRLSLTGTPIENSLTDLWSQMAFLNPGLLGSFQLFRDTFVIPIEKKGDENRKDQLRKLISPFILRRTKEQVAKDLPALTEKLYFSEMTTSQKDLYENTRNYYRKKILENMESWGEARAQFFVLRGLMQLRLIASHPRMYDANYEGDSGKFEDLCNMLESILSEKHKVLIFSQFVRHLDLIAAYLQKNHINYAYLTGQSRKRSEIVQGFKEDESRQVFLISLKAGGVGLNLTEADYVFMCDPWWNPAVEQQAINRAHRIGQDKNVFAYKFISRNTVEEKILQLQEKKKQLSADIIGAGQPFTGLLTKEDVEMLFS